MGKFGVYSLEEIEQMHKEILWPTVRIKAKKAWGSGTVIYSGKDAKGKYHTYVVSCHHVVAENIKIETKFDQRVGFEIKKMSTIPVEVESFYYENLSQCKGSAGSCKADILIFDEDADIALLELKRGDKNKHVASFLPKGDIDTVHVFDKVWAAGAAMAHEPIVTEGIINFLNEPMEYGIEYWMSNAQIIFGNSGGAIFRYSHKSGKFEWIGIPARIAVNISGFSTDAITHMGFFVPITKVYQLIDKFYYQFIYDKAVTYEECEEERKANKKRLEELLVTRFGGKPVPSGDK